MVQKEISLLNVLAWVGWVLAGVCAALGLLFHLHIAGLTAMLAVGSGTLHVRRFLYGLECRERSMYNLGRESGLRSID